VSSILAASGWAEIDIRPIDIACTLPENELVGYITRLGPVGLVLQETDERTRTQVIETVRTAFDPYVHGTEVRFTTACWMVGARVQGWAKARSSRRAHAVPQRTVGPRAHASLCAPYE
jgi:hypothetical protein